jgi:hypothetical protein
MGGDGQTGRRGRAGAGPPAHAFIELPTVAMDVLTTEHDPSLVRHCLRRGAEMMAHGISVSRMITCRMSDEEERDYVNALWDRRIDLDSRMIGDTFETIYREGATSGRLLALHLNP